MKKVYVAIATPNESHLSPFVYGVFDDDDRAHAHFAKNGDKNCTLTVTSAHYIQKAWWEGTKDNHARDTGPG